MILVVGGQKGRNKTGRIVVDPDQEEEDEEDLENKNGHDNKDEKDKKKDLLEDDEEKQPIIVKAGNVLQQNRGQLVFNFLKSPHYFLFESAPSLNQNSQCVIIRNHVSLLLKLF